MGYESDDRLANFAIDDETRAALRDFAPLLQPALPGLCDALCAHMREQPDVIEAPGASGRGAALEIERACHTEIERWRQLLCGRFDGLEGSGLSPHFCLRAHAFVADWLGALATTAFRSRFHAAADRARLARLLVALHKAAMWEVSLVVASDLGNVEQRCNERTSGFAARCEHVMSGVVEKIASAAHDIENSAHALTETISDSLQQSMAAASASEEAAANVQTVASAAEEMVASTQEISQKVLQSSQIAKQAVDEANRTNASVDALAKIAQKIGEVVQLIQDIAHQTNLLALNATIEAARAGEMGKGFAVVASEVKSLARQTAKATEEIETQIAGMQSATSEMVAATKSIGATIGQISEISTAIAAAVEQQSAATGEISKNVVEAARATTDISSNIAGLGTAIRQAGTTAGNVVEATGRLAGHSRELSGEVGALVAVPRAA